MRSFFHAFQGLSTLVATQRNARIHCVVAVLVGVLGAWLEVSRLEWCLLALSIGFVLSAEALNTGIEFLCDAVHPGHHPLIGKAKDVGAAGVLIAAIAATAVGVLVFGQRLGG